MRRYTKLLTTFASLSLLGAGPGQAASSAKAAAKSNSKTYKIPAPEGSKKTISQMMDALKKRADQLNYRWDLSIFSKRDWLMNGYTVNGMPMIYWKCGNEDSPNRSLVLSSVHGDEHTPLYFGFRLVEYIKARPEICHNKFLVIAPVINPDGILRYSRGTRTNYHKVDLNRNFDTPDWWERAHHLWKTKYKSRRRRYPGPRPASEPETIFQQWLVAEFRPTKIMSIHAPLKILDYDGPKTTQALGLAQSYIDSCESLRQTLAKASPLRHYAFGNFPGSLGNYAGKQRGIPTITVELASADPHKAPFYFGQMEKSTLMFFNYQLHNSPYAEPKPNVTQRESQRQPANSSGG